MERSPADTDLYGVRQPTSFIPDFCEAGSTRNRTITNKLLLKKYSGKTEMKRIHQADIQVSPQQLARTFVLNAVECSTFKDGKVKCHI